MRQILIILGIVTIACTTVSAGDVDFSLKVGEFPVTSRPDPRKEARLALWNDPMHRLMYHFNQQQSWVMRGTMPGSERVGGAVISVKAQPGVPLTVLTSSMQFNFGLGNKDLREIRWPWIDDEKLSGMSFEQQLSVLLGRQLVPQ